MHLAISIQVKDEDESDEIVDLLPEGAEFHAILWDDEGRGSIAEYIPASPLPKGDSEV